MLGNKKCSQDTHAVQKSGLGTGWRRLFGGKYYKQRQNGVGLTNAKSQSPGAGASVTARLRGPGHYLPGRTVDFSWLYSKRIPGSHLVLTNVCFCNTFIYLPKTLIFFLYNKTMTKLSQQTQLIPHPISCYLIHTDPFTLSDPSARPLSGVMFLLEAHSWALGAQISLTVLSSAWKAHLHERRLQELWESRILGSEILSSL